MPYGLSKEISSCGTIPRRVWRKRLSLFSAIFAALVLGGHPSMGTDEQPAPEVGSHRMGEDYRLREKPALSVGREPGEQAAMGETFPLYGSREEMIFKPWLKAFYYRKSTGFRLNVEYEREEGEGPP
ncbi:MAG: hypothetical protein GTN70_09635 [Deltaproteobacteria bacterium]|nr:hypothetical protein [Deltaproteobacteria bacterium]NIS78040.1 hypothetical protein [Deltaproteobacteria bacterium]